MTKKELIESEAFKNAPDNALIMIPNWDYQDGVDEREDVTPKNVRFYDFRNEIYLDSLPPLPAKK